MSTHESGKISDALTSIERELSALWAPDPKTPPKARVCTANVVVVMQPAHQAEAAALADALRTAEVARTFLLGVDPRLPPWGIETSVSARCQRDGEQLLCSERIELVVGSAAMTRAGSLVSNLSMAEVPTALVLLDSAPQALWSPLLEGASRVVLDSEILGMEAAKGIAAGTGAALVDLSWERLYPYRNLLARAFDDEALRPALAAVRALRVTAQPADGAGHASLSARLLVGWFASRLGWHIAAPASVVDAGGEPVFVSIEPGRDASAARGALASIELEAERGEEPLRLSIRREGDRLVLSLACGDLSPARLTGAIGSGSLAEVIDRAINLPVADRPLRDAIAAADRFLPPVAPNGKAFS